ncbi:DUF1294 domain-containing protein [Geomonas nitrogeniifigens]|uniref:DUF1294 domain-containing protein n=1 Tax=Geomonas diazotrophica TaxID=2843197 RepID=A0ABX8JMB8_9BACT|nr:DUF1294 domain-containing protein [Geomonas nitrogeniifigens]QWV98702.1 DUF1294 domain-containing protein [Geomonas nitrogeniifigens]QXE87859.1 DUF1294 domain-containing protein [Geomonas nitrogeniifigens]
MGYAEAKEHRKPPSYLWGPSFLLLLCALVRLELLPAPLLSAYLLSSLAAFFLYAADKSAAIRGARRISERTLHLAGLFGGWPGALLAQRLLHHKSQKGSFQLAFRFTVLANSAALALYAYGRPGG